MFRFILLPLALCACGGASFDFEAGFDPDAPLAIDPALSPLELDFEDGFFLTTELEGQPMVGLLASTYDDVCTRYAGFLPEAERNYNGMLNGNGGDEEQAVLDAWQAALDEYFPEEGGIFFLAMGVDSLGTEDVEITAEQVLNMATTTFDMEQGPQPAGTFVADLFYRTDALNIPCYYAGDCTDAEVEAANDAYLNYYAADAGTVTINRYNPDKRLKGELDIDLVSRQIDSQLGVAAVLGSATAEFSLPYCEEVDERIFRFYSFL